MASWALFHWAEFAVTAGWNLEKCSVDCALTARPVSLSETQILSISTGQWRPVPHRKWNGIGGIFIDSVLLAELQIE
jgi:hypothetical protein